MSHFFATGFEDGRGDGVPPTSAITGSRSAYNWLHGARTGSPGRGTMGRRSNTGNNNTCVLSLDATQFANSTDMYHVFWVYVEQMPPTLPLRLLAGRTSNTTANYVILRLYPDGSLDLFEVDGSNIVGSTAAGTIQAGQWYQFKCFFRRNNITAQPLPNPPYDTNGMAQIYVDDALVIDYQPTTSTFLGSLHNYQFPTRWITWELGHERLDTPANWPAWLYFDDWTISQTGFEELHCLATYPEGFGNGHTWVAGALQDAEMVLTQAVDPSAGGGFIPNVTGATALTVASFRMLKFSAMGGVGTSVGTPRLYIVRSGGTWATVDVYVNGVSVWSNLVDAQQVIFLHGVTFDADDEVEIRIQKDNTTTSRSLSGIGLYAEFETAVVAEPSQDIRIERLTITANNGRQVWVPTSFQPDIIIGNRADGNVNGVIVERKAWMHGTFRPSYQADSKQIPTILPSGFWLCSYNSSSQLLASGVSIDFILIQDAYERVFPQIYGGGHSTLASTAYQRPAVPWSVQPASNVEPEVALAATYATSSSGLGHFIKTDLHLGNDITDPTNQAAPYAASGLSLSSREALANVNTFTHFHGFGLGRSGFNANILIGRTQYIGNGSASPRVIDTDGQAIFAIVFPYSGGSSNRPTHYRSTSMSGLTSRVGHTTSLVTSGGLMGLGAGNVLIGSQLNVSGAAYEVLSFYEGVDPFIIDTNVTQVVIQAMLPDTATCPEPEDGEDFCASIDDPLLFASWEADGTRRYYAETDLDDPADYYGGWKEGRILGISEVRRALSGTTHTLEVGGFNITLADEDYAIRSILIDDEGRYWNNREIEIFAVTPEGRRELAMPRKIATGYIDAEPEYDPTGDAMSVRFKCRDRLGASQGWTPFGQQMVPRRTLTQTTLPGVISGVVGQAAPIPYGVLNTLVVPSGSMAIPSPGGNPIYGAYTDGVRWYTGFASMAEGPSIASGISVAVQAGGSLPTSVPSSEYYAQVWPVDADGVIGDPMPYSPYDAVVTVSPGNQQIEVSWMAASGAARYYVYLGTFEPGIRWSQFIDTTGLLAVFDRGPGPSEPASYDNITVGARLAQPGQRWQYGIRARSGTGRSLVSPIELIGISSVQLPNGRFRPLLVTWDDVPAATSYEMYRKTVGGASYDRLWTVPPQYVPTLDFRYGIDDLQDTDVTYVGSEPERQGGAVKCLYVGDEVLSDNQTWRRMLVAGCAVKEISSWYYDAGGSSDIEINVGGDGTDFLIPSDLPTATWPTYFLNKYRDIVGTDGVTRRYTMIYAKGTKGDLLASGTATLSVNLQGVESQGTGNGELLTDLFDQFTHVLTNFILASGEGYTNGPWFDMPTIGETGVCAINSESVEAIQAQRVEEFAIRGVSGGLQGAGIMGAYGRQVTVTEEIKRWCTCGDFRVGVNRHWQIGVYALQGAAAVVAGEIPQLTDEHDIHMRSMKITPRLGELCNVFPYRYKRNYLADGWDADNLTRINQDSINKWRVRQEREAIEMHYIRDAAIAEIVVDMYEFRSAPQVPTYVTLEGSVCLLNSEFDVGRYVRMPHWRGIGVSGWANRPLWILASTFNPETRRVRLDCMDVQFIAADGGGW